MLKTILAAHLALATAAHAQAVQLTARTVDNLIVRAGPMLQTLPGNTDVGAGFDLRAVARATASAKLEIDSTAERLTVRYTAEANAFSDPRGGAVETAAVTGPSAAHRLRFTFMAAVAFPARLRVTTHLCLSDGSGICAVHAPGRTVTANDTCAPETTLLPIAIGPTGTTVDVEAYVVDFVGWPFFRPATAACTLELEPDPDYPCPHVGYGAGCFGGELRATTDFVAPGTHVLTLSNAQPFPIALLGFGDQRLSIQFGACTLLNNVVFTLGVPVQQGVARFRFAPPPIPGLTFQAQGAMGLLSGELALTNGVEFRCP
jgi:hypothetical protein